MTIPLKLVSVVALAAAATGLSAAVAGPRAHAHATHVATADALPVVTVYKSPSCICCARWVDHMRAAGFKVNVRDVDDVDVMKDELGVPGPLRSCHTAMVGGYTIEGHVPAELVQKLLREHAKVAGLAVPGMVTGSPGMEGGRKEPYDVIAYGLDGHTQVYAHR
jgi:hypothetical protein